MKDAIRRFVIDDLLSGEVVADDENLLLSGLVDSLGVMRLIAFIEQKSGLKVPPGDVTLENFQSLDAIGAYLSGQVPA